MDVCGSKKDEWLSISFFFLFIFNWRIIALQCCAGFCNTTM